MGHLLNSNLCKRTLKFRTKRKMGLFSGIWNTVKGIFRSKETKKMQRHANKKGKTLDEYLMQKYGPKAEAARRERETIQHIIDEQLRRKKSMVMLEKRKKIEE